jgi:hypothetical protein
MSPLLRNSGRSASARAIFGTIRLQVREDQKYPGCEVSRIQLERSSKRAFGICVLPSHVQDEPVAETQIRRKGIHGDSLVDDADRRRRNDRNAVSATP